MQLLACSIAALIAAISSAASANAQTGPSLVDKVDAAIDADADRLTDIFKDLHRNPEIAFTEFRTAAIVAKELEALGYEVTTGIGGTGVVGVLRNGSGPTLWYRADMDANGGLVETTGLDYAASGPQRVPDGTEVDAMHACGHDAHVTWMLGLARAMVELDQLAWWTDALRAAREKSERSLQTA